MKKTNALSSKAVGLLMMSCFLGGSFSLMEDANALTGLRNDTKAPVVIAAITIEKSPVPGLKSGTIVKGAAIDQIGGLVVKQAQILNVTPAALLSNFAFSAVDANGVKYVVSINQAGKMILAPVVATKAAR
jgi:hypothetical protein